MIVSHKFLFLKIDIPKTGTCSWRRAIKAVNAYDFHGTLRGVFRQHSPAWKAKKQFEENNWDWQNYYKITLVRNPWERLASLCMYKKRIKPMKNEDQFTYDEMLEMLVHNQPAQDWYFLGNGKCIINRVGRFENYAEEFELFKRKVGLPQLKMQYVNKSEPYDYRKMFTDDLAQKVAEKEKYIIENFGYQFDDVFRG